MSTTNGLTTLDHIALVVRDLDAATSNYTALFGCQPSWHRSDSGAEHAWFQLGNIALDIVAPSGSGDAGTRVQAQLDHHGEGICAIAFATTDITKARHTLERRGIPSTEPLVMLSTTTSALALSATHGVSIALIERTEKDRPAPIIASNAAVSGLDHIVIATPQPDRAAALYGARLGLEMKLDRTNPAWGSRLMFFKCGDLVVEIAHNLKNGLSDDPDHAWGLSWRVPNIDATRARLAAEGFNVSDVRVGRKPGTKVFTVRDRNANVPTIMLGRV